MRPLKLVLTVITEVNYCKVFTVFPSYNYIKQIKQTAFSPWCFASSAPFTGVRHKL